MTGHLRIGSLCSGYSGLDMAVQAVSGGSAAWHCENDPDASKVLAHHWPGVPNLGDLTAIDWTSVEPVDVVTAGFPCTDLSYAGRGEGILRGNRSGLWYAIADALGVLRPRHVVLENVAAIVGRRPGLDVVLASLASLGFDARWTCVRASDVGAPHRRDRWFCVATDTSGERRERDRAPRRRRNGPAHDGSLAAYTNGHAIRQQPVAEPGVGSTTLAGPAGAGTPAHASGPGRQGPGSVEPDA